MKVHELIAELKKWPLYYEVVMEGTGLEADTTEILCVKGYNGGMMIRRK